MFRNKNVIVYPDSWGANCGATDHQDCLGCCLNNAGGVQLDNVGLSADLLQSSKSSFLAKKPRRPHDWQSAPTFRELPDLK